MTRRELAAVLALLATVLILAALWPPSTKSDQPVAAAVPASEFVAIGSVGSGAGTHDPSPAEPTGAPRPPRTPSPTLPTTPVASVSPSASMGTPVRSPAHQAATVDRTVLASGSESVTGTASWFASPIGVSAAGPALRTALGPGWRGTLVAVCSDGRCAVTVLGDWMRADRLIDLDVSVFPAVCGPLSLGLCRVEVTLP